MGFERVEERRDLDWRSDEQQASESCVERGEREMDGWEVEWVNGWSGCR